MNLLRKLPGGLVVTRWWNNGAYAWTVGFGNDQVVLDLYDIVALAMFVDPVVFDALLAEARKEER